MAPPLDGIIETALYVHDPRVSAEFYVRVLGLRQMGDGERLISMSVRDSHVLLLFKKGGSREPTRFAGGTIPANDAQGEIHFAFAIPAGSFGEWEAWLPAQGVEIESIVNWERGGKSLYFRDPDGHNVELATPGIWDMY